MISNNYLDVLLRLERSGRTFNGFMTILKDAHASGELNRQDLEDTIKAFYDAMSPNDEFNNRRVRTATAKIIHRVKEEERASIAQEQVK